MASVTWKGNRKFEAQSQNGVSWVMDATADHGGEGAGPSPFEAFLSSAAACSAVDVISILEKKQQTITRYHVEIESVRRVEGDFPHPLVNLKLTHVVEGKDIDPNAVAQAVKLSDEKYCSVIASLRERVSVTSLWKVADGSPSAAASPADPQ